MLSIYKKLLPPFFLSLINRLLGATNTYKGNYQSWEQAMEHASGYSKQEIIDKVFISAKKVRDGQAIFERDSKVFYHQEFNWPLITACYLARKKQEVLDILDYGGSLGSSYYQNRKLLEKCQPYKWKIIEQSDIVEIGINEFIDNNLEFHHNLDEIFSADVVILSSVLQYLESPYEILKSIMNISPSIIFIDRTPFLNTRQDLLTVQHVNRNLYDASYPAWFFSDEIFKNEIHGMGYRIIAEHSSNEIANIDSTFKSILIERVGV